MAPHCLHSVNFSLKMWCVNRKLEIQQGQQTKRQLVSHRSQEEGQAGPQEATREAAVSVRSGTGRKELWARPIVVIEKGKGEAGYVRSSGNGTSTVAQRVRDS